MGEANAISAVPPLAASRPGTVSSPAVPTGDYERFRQRLEEQLRAEMELLYEGYRAKLRAYEMVARLRGELDVEPWPPVELARSLLPAAGAARLSPGSPEPMAPAPQAAPPPAQQRRKAYELLDAITGAFAALPEVFDKRDIGRVLGFMPRRSTLHGSLQFLIDDRVIAVEAYGSGNQPTRYRKLTPPAVPAS